MPFQPGSPSTVSGTARKTCAGSRLIFATRQMGRMALVGCTSENAPLIEATMRRLCRIMESCLETQQFWFGSRPSLAEFSLDGPVLTTGQRSHAQLPDARDCAADLPLACATRRHVGPRRRTGGKLGAPRPAVIEQMLMFAGEVYFPFLLANERAINSNKPTFSFAALGMSYEQGAFAYQRNAWKLFAPDTRRFQRLPAPISSLLLEKTGCAAALRTA